MIRLQTRFFESSRPQITPRNLGFLSFAVPLKPYDFHSVQERLADRIQGIRSRNEKYFGEIEWQVEIMIPERMVLGRIQDFQERRRGIAAEVATQLVHFVQHEDGIVDPGSTHRLYDPSGQGADIGPAMPAKFSLIM